MKKIEFLSQNGFDSTEASRIIPVIEKFKAEPAGVIPHNQTWEEIKLEIKKHNKKYF